jgi:LuxR family maltose regulon positive regulatory protein
MSAGIASGRFGPPVYRVPLLPRVTLRRRLDGALDYLLTVIEAPAGFGKTSLLAQWRAEQVQKGISTAWLSIGEEALGPLELLSDVVQSLALAGLDLGQLASLAAEGLADLPPKAVLEKLSAAIRDDPTQRVLIIDDVHNISPALFGQVIRPLVDLVTPQLHMVLSGRDRLPLSYPELTGRGLLLSIKADELRFTEEETRAILAVVPPSAVELLAKSTEGWPIAVQLCRAWLQTNPDRADRIRSFSGRVSEIADYLTEQVLAGFPESGRAMLRDLAIVDSFNAELAAALTGQPSAWQVVSGRAELEYLLVPLDDERYWFRYHHLLRDYLQHWLQQAPIEHIKGLHRRAALWYETHGLVQDAVRHACAAGEYGHAAALIERGGIWEMINFGGHAKLRQLIQEMPQERVHEYPRIYLGELLLVAKAGRVREAYQKLLDIREATGGFSRVSAAQREILQRDALMVSELIIGYADLPRAPDALEKVMKAADAFPPEDYVGHAGMMNVAALTALALGNMSAAVDVCQRAVRAMRHIGSVLGVDYCYLHLGLAHLHAGSRREAEAVFREALALAEENFGADSGLRACAGVLLAAALYWGGDISGAQQQISASLPQVEAGDGWLDLFAEGYEVAAMLAFAEQDTRALGEILARMEATAEARGYGRLGALKHVLTARYAALRGELTEAAEALAKIVPAYRPGLSQDDPFWWRVHDEAGLVTAMLALARGNYPSAEMILKDLANAAGAAARSVQLASVRVLQVVARLHRGDTAEACSMLAETLAARESEGDLQRLARLGRLIIPLVRETRAWADEHSPSIRVRNALSALTTSIEGLGGARGNPSLPLTGRELEVLGALARGGTNKVIARKLQMTENTVKFHLKNIFQKLGVRHRTDATRIARENDV